MTIRVRATTAVAGMWAGDEYDVHPEDDFIKLLLSVGHLVRVDDEKEAVEEKPFEPVVVEKPAREEEKPKDEEPAKPVATARKSSVKPESGAKGE
jgi:hypothetical protein